MPNYTVAINDQKELDALAFDRQRVNAHRQGQDPVLPVLTEAQFIQWIVQQSYLPSIIDRYNDSQKRDVAEAWESADAAKRTQVNTVLGLNR